MYGFKQVLVPDYTLPIPPPPCPPIIIKETKPSSRRKRVKATKRKSVNRRDKVFWDSIRNRRKGFNENRRRLQEQFSTLGPMSMDQSIAKRAYGELKRPREKGDLLPEEEVTHLADLALTGGKQYKKVKKLVKRHQSQHHLQELAHDEIPAEAWGWMEAYEEPSVAMLPIPEHGNAVVPHSPPGQRMERLELERSVNIGNPLFTEARTELALPALQREIEREFRETIRPKPRGWDKYESNRKLLGLSRTDRRDLYSSDEEW